MKNKRIFYTEWAYFCGLVFLALGTAFMEAANFGVSMVVAPAYLLYLKLSTVWPAFTFGMAEYILQFVLLIALTVIMRRFRFSYLLSFVTALIYGLLLDGSMALVALIPGGGNVLRVVFYIVGMFVGSVGVAFIFHTYIPPEAYELFVKDCAEKFGWKVSHFKTLYDCVSCAAAILMSFIFFGFGHFEGVRLGTIICALVNGWLIGRCSACMEYFFTFRDGTSLRSKLG